MKVRCHKILSDFPPRRDLGSKTNSLTVGGEYIVLAVYSNNKNAILYHIETDSGDLVIFHADQFEVISKYIPSNWEVRIEADLTKPHYIELSPKNWNQDSFSFYEEIIEVSWPLYEWRKCEKIPEVISLYFKERDLIYREESEYEKREKI